MILTINIPVVVTVVVVVIGLCRFQQLFFSQTYHDGQVSLFCLFVCFVALRPKSTAMVIVGRSVHLTTLFPGQA